MTNGMTAERLAEIAEHLDDKCYHNQATYYQMLLKELLAEVERLREGNKDTTEAKYNLALSLLGRAYSNGQRVERGNWMFLRTQNRDEPWMVYRHRNDAPKVDVGTPEGRKIWQDYLENDGSEGPILFTEENLHGAVDFFIRCLLEEE